MPLPHRARSRLPAVTAAVAVLALCLTACGSAEHAGSAENGDIGAPSVSGPPPSIVASGTALDPPTAITTFKALIAPVDQALSTMKTKLLALPPDADGDDLAKITEPAAAAIDTFDKAALATQWPTIMRKPVVELATLDRQFSADLRAAKNQDATTIATWEYVVTQDGGKEQSLRNTIVGALNAASSQAVASLAAASPSASSGS